MESNLSLILHLVGFYVSFLFECLGLLLIYICVCVHMFGNDVLPKTSNTVHISDDYPHGRMFVGWFAVGS